MRAIEVGWGVGFVINPYNLQSKKYNFRNILPVSGGQIPMIVMMGSGLLVLAIGQLILILCLFNLVARYNLVFNLVARYNLVFNIVARYNLVFVSCCQV